MASRLFSRDSEIEDEPLASRRADCVKPVDDRPFHPVAIHGENDFAHRTIRNDGHAQAWLRQCWVHLFFSGDFSDVDFWALCLWLGLSHSRFAGFLRLASQENWNDSKTVPISVARLCSSDCRLVHVCLADS